MATLQLINRYREGAEIYRGAEICRMKSIEFLEQNHLPRGLLPLTDIEEVGYNHQTGFIWLRQRKRTDHFFKRIGRLVSFAPEVTAFIEKHRMTKIKGVKSKELIFWFSLSDMCIDDPASRKINFRASAGLSLTYPVSAFEPEEDQMI